MTLPISKVSSLVVSALIKIGFPTTEAWETMYWIMWATMRGNKQDIRKLAQMRHKPTGHMAFSKNGAVGHLRAAFHHPVQALNRASTEAVALAHRSGIGMVCVSETDQSSGALGYFTSAIAKQNLFAFLTSSTPPLVAVAGGTKAVVGTNPVSFAVPSNQGPIVFDGSGAGISYYGLLDARAKGEQLPQGVGVDASGNPTTDANEVKAILPKGVYGSGILTMVQLLSTFMFGSKVWGHVLIVAKPMQDLEAALLGVSEQATELRGGEVDESKVYLPGERGDAQARACMETAQVTIDDQLYQELLKLAGEEE